LKRLKKEKIQTKIAIFLGFFHMPRPHEVWVRELIEK
jgi:hypothetical protein